MHEYPESKSLGIITLALLLAPFVSLGTSLVAASHYGLFVGQCTLFVVFLVLVIVLVVVFFLYCRRPSSHVRIWQSLLYTLGTAFAAVVLSGSLWPQLLRWLVEWLNRRLGLGLPEPIFESLLPYFLALCVVVCILAFCAAWMLRTTVSPSAGIPVSLPVARDAVRDYCRALTSALDIDDREANWANWVDRRYVTLEAQVEADGTNYRHAEVVPNLVEAIRKNRREGVFVLIGEPGSGKTVSLKRLVRALCAEAGDTNRVPVYANLRAFPKDTGVTAGSLMEFIRTTVAKQTLDAGNRFRDDLFDKARLESHQVFLVLDAFDELPQILDANDGGKTLDEVCNEFNRLFSGMFPGCRCLLASRPFRAPSGVGGSRLTLRPLTEKQIEDLLDRRFEESGHNSKKLVRDVFVNRPQWVGYLRNPFYAALIAEYVLKRSVLPSTLYDLFDSFISDRLETTAQQAKSAGSLTRVHLQNAAESIATKLYGDNTTNPGLELPMRDVETCLSGEWPGREKMLIVTLKNSRLVRGGELGSGHFAFSHRRFAEFFAVAALKKSGNTPPLDHIPTDSRWRDGLVIFTGVTDDHNRRQIAEYCWTELQSNSYELSHGCVGDAIRAIHCLRFLTEAFRSHLDDLAGFCRDLGKLIRTLVASSDPLTAKIGAEAIPLLDDVQRQSTLTAAVASNFEWVRETAVVSCRNFPILDDTTREKIRAYHRLMPFERKLVRWKQLEFTLSLSEAFRPLLRAAKFDWWEGSLRLIALLAAVIILTVEDLPSALIVSGLPLMFLSFYYSYLVLASWKVQDAESQPPSLPTVRVVSAWFGASLALVSGIDLLAKRAAHIAPTEENAGETTDAIDGAFSDAFSVVFSPIVERLQPIAEMFGPLGEWWTTRRMRDDGTSLVVWLLVGFAFLSGSLVNWENIRDALRGIVRHSLKIPSKARTVKSAIRDFTDKVVDKMPRDLRALSEIVRGGRAEITTFVAEARQGIIVMAAIILLTVFFPIVAAYVFAYAALIYLLFIIVMTIIAVSVGGLRMIRNRRLTSSILARGVPPAASLKLVFVTLQELPTNTGRRAYLTRLLARRIPLQPGEPPPYLPPNIEELLTPDVQAYEAWAKLKEFWFGLSR